MEIDSALVDGKSVRWVSRTFGGLSPAGVSRHRANHLPLALIEAEREREIEHGSTLLKRLDHLAYRAYGILDRAENSPSERNASSGLLKKELPLLASQPSSVEPPHPTFLLWRNPDISNWG